MIETLLNTLEAERYVRGPLLETVIDALAATPMLAPALEVAHELQEALARGVGDREFASRMRELRLIVQSLQVPESGIRVVDAKPRDVEPVQARTIVAA